MDWVSPAAWVAVLHLGARVSKATTLRHWWAGGVTQMVWSPAVDGGL